MLSLSSTLTGHGERVWECAWSPDGKTLASCGSDKCVRLWEEEVSAGRWAQAAVLAEEQRRTVRAVAWSPCGRYLASGSFDATVVVWEKRDGAWAARGTLEGHENEIKRLAWSPSGRFLASASRDKTVWLWEMDEEEEFSCSSVLQAHSADVKHVAWDARADVLYSAGYDDSLRSYAFDGDDWVEVWADAKAHQSTVWALALRPEGGEMASCSQDGVLLLWEARPRGAAPDATTSWDVVATLGRDWDSGPLYYVAWDGRSGLIALASEDNSIRLVGREEGAGGLPASFALRHHEREAHDEDVNCVAFHPTRPLLASASDDGTVKLWNLQPHL